MSDSKLPIDRLEQREWLERGIRLGFCTPSWCYQHDIGFPTKEMEAEWARGGDPCEVVVRIR